MDMGKIADIVFFYHGDSTTSKEYVLFGLRCDEGNTGIYFLQDRDFSKTNIILWSVDNKKNKGLVIRGYGEEVNEVT